MNRIVTTITAGGGVRLTSGSTTKVHHKRSYGAAGRLKKVENALHNYTAQYDYAAGSLAKISGIAHHHGATHSLQHSRSYDGYGRPVGSDTPSQITAPVYAHRYTLDALGRRIADCAALYFRYADNPHPPQELRLKARLNAIRVLGESGNSDAIASHLPRIETEARNLLPDWFAVLNICRYLMFGGKDARAAAERLYTLANTAALQELAATTNNTRQVEILEQLNRRRVYDLGKNHDAIEQYHALKDHIHNTLWSPSNTYFDYLRWIGLALCRHTPEQAAAHYQSILEDAATPSCPRAQLSLDLAEHLIHHHKQPARALALIENTLAEHPTGSHTPRAHYWLMLAAREKNNTASAQHHAQMLLAAQGKTTDLNSVLYEIAAQDILHDSNTQQASKKFSEDWSPETVERALGVMRVRISKIRGE